VLLSSREKNGIRFVLITVVVATWMYQIARLT
jgi:hypothetical protein